MHYVELHARSAFSFLRGACTPEQIADRCEELQQPGMALLDFDGVYGAPRFHNALIKKSGMVRDTPLLAATRTGYQNLCRMITRMKLRVGKHPKPGRIAAVTPEELAEFAGGLICLTGGEDGPLARGLHEGRATIERLVRVFGKGHVYLELQRHFDRDQEARNQAIIELGRAMRMPLVATNGACYAHPAQRELLDVFACLHHKNHARSRRTPAGPQRRALPQIHRANDAVVRRRAGSDS